MCSLVGGALSIPLPVRPLRPFRRSCLARVTSRGGGLLLHVNTLFTTSFCVGVVLFPSRVSRVLAQELLMFGSGWNEGG